MPASTRWKPAQAKKMISGDYKSENARTVSPISEPRAPTSTRDNHTIAGTLTAGDEERSPDLRRCPDDDLQDARAARCNPEMTWPEACKATGPVCI